MPSIPGLRTLVDRDTPDEALTRTGFDGKTYNLVFSDEFEVDGRSFFEGDDPYFTAIDAHYWWAVFVTVFGLLSSEGLTKCCTTTGEREIDSGTIRMLVSMNLSFVVSNPAKAPGSLPPVTTRGGSMVITITEEQIHNLDYKSAMVQSWNQLCFTGGYIEVRVSLPGSSTVGGFWRE